MERGVDFGTNEVWFWNDSRWYLFGQATTRRCTGCALLQLKWVPTHPPLRNIWHRGVFSLTLNLIAGLQLLKDLGVPRESWMLDLVWFSHFSDVTGVSICTLILYELIAGSFYSLKAVWEVDLWRLFLFGVDTEPAVTLMARRVEVWRFVAGARKKEWEHLCLIDLSSPLNFIA